MSEVKEFNDQEFLDTKADDSLTPSSLWRYSGEEDPFLGQYESLDVVCGGDESIDELCRQIDYSIINVGFAGIGVVYKVKDRIRYLSRQLMALEVTEEETLKSEKERYWLTKGRFTDDAFVFNYVMEADSRNPDDILECCQWHTGAVERIQWLTKRIEELS